MKIILDEKSVFTYNKKDLTIHIHTHEEGIYKGDTFEEGSIKFANYSQANQFKEMIQLMEDKK